MTRPHLTPDEIAAAMFKGTIEMMFNGASLTEEARTLTADELTHLARGFCTRSTSEQEPERLIAMNAWAALRVNPEVTELAARVQVDLCIIPATTVMSIAAEKGSKAPALHTVGHLSPRDALRLGQELITAAHSAKYYDQLGAWAMSPDNDDPNSGLGCDVLDAAALVERIVGHAKPVTVIAYEPQEGTDVQEEDHRGPEGPEPAAGPVGGRGASGGPYN